MTCKLCGREIESVRSAWKEQTGWVSPRGAKSMTQAHPTGALAHGDCISLLKSGINIQQTTLEA